MSWLYQPFPLAGVQDVNPDVTLALTGEASATGIGSVAIVNDEEGLTGLESATAQGSFTRSSFVRLRSRKTGTSGSTAEYLLTTQVVTSSQGTALNGVSVLLGGTGVTTSQQSFPVKTVARLLTGQERTMSRGTVTYVPQGAGSLPSWVQPATQVDEEIFYNTNFGVDSGKEIAWAFTSSDKNLGFSSSPADGTTWLPNSYTIHESLEGDELWNHYMSYKRASVSANGSIHLTWCNSWRNYYVTNYVNDLITEDLNVVGDIDHMFLQGLVMWGMEQNDEAAKQTARDIMALSEDHILTYTPGVNNPSSGEGRKFARWTICACYLVMMEPIPRWITLRDHLIELWLQSPGWSDSNNSNIVSGGHHFAAQVTTIGHPPAHYDEGYRYNATFIMALIAEGLWLSYKQTGRQDIRGMVIEMARYILYYAWDPIQTINPMCGTRWGHKGDGTHLHQYSDEYGGSPKPPGWVYDDPLHAPTDNYEASLVNTLVYGYKLTGELPFLARAREHFREATTYSSPNSGANRLDDTQVHFFIDTKIDTSTFGLSAYNKGQFQYAGHLFENGGLPEVESTWPPYSVPLVSGQVLPIGFNKPGDVRPSGITTSDWYYALFDYYGGGVFNEDYSPAGAWTIAGGGGHAVPACNQGGTVFDFEDGLWKLHPALHTGVTPRGSDYIPSEVTGGIIVGSSPDCPAPAHQYQKIAHWPAAKGGGSMGSFLRLQGTGMTTSGSEGAGTWRFDWETNQWTRIIPEGNTELGNLIASSKCRNGFWIPSMDRWVVVTNALDDPIAPNVTAYLRGSDLTWQSDVITGVVGSGNCKSTFYDEERNIIVAISPTLKRMWGANLNSTTAWTELTIANSSLIEDGTECQWAYYPPDGCFYTNRGNVDRDYLVKMTPPVYDGINKFTGTWTVSQAPLSSTLTSMNPSAQGFQHHNRLFYVPSLQLLAWIPGYPRADANQHVFLIKP